MGSLDLRSSRALILSNISAGTGSVLIRRRPEDIYRDAAFRMMILRLILRSICKLMRIGRWSQPKFVFVCQLVEVIREADANEISGEDGVALPGSLVGES